KKKTMLVLVNGTGPHEFTPEEIEAVAAYVRAGGVILFESPGGGASFTISAEAAMEATFGAPPMTLLSHPIVTGEDVPGGTSLASVEYRPLALETFGARETLPRLRGITVDGEPRVLFSREDLSFGWLDQPRWGIVGYATPSARALMGNIVRWAHGRRR
ncbi:MAG: hypothetical protein KDA25_11010, partial [Phycisphaerales bacterium]|nr:hypothetical protein [Phycisphaerales bacterium]